MLCVDAYALVVRLSMHKEQAKPVSLQHNVSLAPWNFEIVQASELVNTSRLGAFITFIQQSVLISP